MKPTKSQVTRKIIAISLAAFSFAAILMSSIAWFSTGGSTIDFGTNGAPNVIGGMEVAYYGGGSGTIDDPYIISNKNHLYNLAWLQYLGKYNTVDYTVATPTKSIQENYFKITNDIDMKGMVLPPIGTETYPFFGHLYSDKLDNNGHFTGEPCSIINLIVSNDDPRQSDSDFGVNKPKKINDFGHAFLLNGTSNVTRVIGFMGAVGKIPTNTVITSQDVASITPSIDNLTLENIRIQNKTQQMLIGLAAGYVDGTMSGVKVSGSSYLKIEKVNGQSDAVDTTNISKNLSDYGLVGYSKFAGSSGAYSQSLSKFYDSTDPAHGGIDWGGSFDSRSYNDWIYSLYKGTKTSTNGDVYEYSSMQFGADTSFNFNTKNFSDFKLKFATNYKTDVYGKNGNYTSYDYYMNPNNFCDPEDGKQVRNTSGIYCTVYQLKDGCYLPLKFNLDKTGTDLKNTGYIVGASYGEQRLITASPKLSSYYYSSIGNSLQNTYWTVGSALANKALSYSDSSLEVLTYSTTDDKWYRITDTHNSSNTTTNSEMVKYDRKTLSQLNLSKYVSARQDFQTAAESSNRMHGIHFESVEVSASNKLSVSSGIKINGNSYTTSYDLLKGSINFNLANGGFINFFAGTYYTQTKNFNFFSLYKVNRTGGTINSIQRIKKIYNNTAAGDDYVYLYDDNTYSSGTAGTLIFDVEKALEADAKVNNALYYFEVPVNAGEYAMGMVPGKSSSYCGAYLTYLDISVNGENGVENSISAYSVTTSAKSNKYPAGVDFAIAGIGNNGGETFCVVIAAQVSGNTKYTITSNKVDISSGGGSVAIPANYSYRSNRYQANDPPDTGHFTVTGASGYDYVYNNPTRRVSHISVKGSDNNRHLVLITDLIDDGEITQTTCSYDGIELSLSTIQNSSHAPLLTNDIVTAIRNQGAAIILTRTNDSNNTIFDCELPNNPQDWTNKDVYNVGIRPYPTGLKISITNENVSKYTLNINGSTISFAQSNPVIYTGS